MNSVLYPAEHMLSLKGCFYRPSLGHTTTRIAMSSNYRKLLEGCIRSNHLQMAGFVTWLVNNLLVASFATISFQF